MHTIPNRTIKVERDEPAPASAEPIASGAAKDTLEITTPPERESPRPGATLNRRFIRCGHFNMNGSKEEQHGAKDEINKGAQGERDLGVSHETPLWARVANHSLSVSYKDAVRAAS